MKHELLCPAGDMESLKQAVMNGADAVYLACKNFGARKFAENFTNEEIIEAIKFCHLYGVKIYVTMNTLVKDEEVSMFLGQVEFLYRNGIDALLVQDFGMICLLRQRYPQLNIHASTQANTSAKETAELFYKLGCQRVVFSRELSLKEIKEIKVPIEKEVFIHGALCVSYSGCCLMSSMLGDRSGNRGECTGSCRLKYSLKHGDRVIVQDKYLLSTKELNTAPRFKELLDSDILSFKIEGRMKSPEYVGFVTRYYRNLIDNYGNVLNLQEETNKLKTLYNREFTVGRLFDATDEDIMNIDTPNHIGLEIGRTLEVTKDKIKIKLDRVLNQQDGIRFLQSGKGLIVNYLYDEEGKLTNSSEDICYIDNKIGLEANDKVYKTLDYKLMQELKKLPVRKVPITMRAVVKAGEFFSLEINDGENTVKATSGIVDVAMNAPLDEERIREQLEKLGDTPFISTATVIEMGDSVFFNIGQINEVRRTAINQLIEVRKNKKKDVVIENVKLDVITKSLEKGLTCSCNNANQIDYCNRLGYKRIYLKDEKLYNDYKSFTNVYYKVPRNRFVINEHLKRRNLISEYFDFTENDFLVGDYGLNVTNIYTAYYLYKMGLEAVCLSVELKEDEIINFINTYIKYFGKYPSIEVVGHSRYENMLIKGNILNIKENDYKYILVNSKGLEFPVYYDGVNTHILNYEVKELKNINTFMKYANVRIDFENEDEKSIEKITNKFNGKKY